MKARFTAHKLEDADVSHISLVARGANRAPFKVIKKDKELDMIDLSKFIKKADNKTAALCLGYVLPKTALVEPVLKALKDAGVDTAKPEESEGTVLFRTSDEKFKEDEVTVMKMSDAFAVLVKGFDPKKDFADVIKAEGFLPGVTAVTEKLYASVRTALEGEQAESAKKIEAALTDYKGYVATIAQDIPAVAFKVEAAVAKALSEHEAATEKSKKAMKSPEEMVAAGDTDEAIMAAHNMTAEQVAALRGSAKKKEEPAEKVTQPDMETLVAAVTKGVAGTVTEQIKAALKPVAEQITAVQGQVEGVTKAQGDLAKQIEAVDATAKKADKAVASLVLGTAPDDRRIVKNDEDEDAGELGIIDTAFMNVRKNEGTFAQRQHGGTRARK